MTDKAKKNIDDCGASFSQAYDFWNDDDNEELEIYKSLIKDLLWEIKDQNIEIVSLRYLLSNYMVDDYGETLRGEIFSSLHPLFLTDSFDYYVENECNGEDPLDEKQYNRKLHKAAKGYRVDYHPLIYLDALKKQ